MIKIRVKTEEGKKIISKVTDRYIRALGAAPFYWRSNEFIILSAERAIFSAIAEEAGKDFYKYFDLIEGYWVSGDRIVRARDWLRQKLCDGGDVRG